MTTGRRRRADPGHGAALRHDLLVAAEALLESSGDEAAVTVRAVAAAVGVTTPSVYLHFADRAELLDAVCLRVWDQMAAESEAAVVGIEDPFARLRVRGIALVGFARRHPLQYRLLMMRPAGARPLRVEAGRSAYRLLRECVEECVETGALRGDPHHLAIGLLAATHGVASLLITHPCLVAGDPDAPVDDPGDLDDLDDVDEAAAAAVVDHCIRVAGLGNALAGRFGATVGPRPSAVLGPALDRLVDDVRRQGAGPEPHEPAGPTAAAGPTEETP